MLVNEKCQVEFQIRTYKDKFLCDVMPMDVFRVSLQIPWKFERKVTYDGKENTFTFEKDGTRNTLLPLKDEKPKQKVSQRVLLKGGKES